MFVLEYAAFDRGKTMDIVGSKHLVGAELDVEEAGGRGNARS